MKFLGRKSNLRLLVRRPLVFARAYRRPLLFLLAAATADVATTVAGAISYGGEAEVHPALRLAIRLFGPIAGPILGKLGQLVFAIAVASLWRWWCTWLLLLCGLLYALAAASNHFMWL